MGGCGLDSCSSGQGPIVGSCEHGTERSDCIRTRILCNWATISFSREVMPYGVGFDNIALQLKLDFSDIIVSFWTFYFAVRYCTWRFVDQ
jgi:hypothetical protein